MADNLLYKRQGPSSSDPPSPTSSTTSTSTSSTSDSATSTSSSSTTSTTSTSTSTSASTSSSSDTSTPTPPSDTSTTASPTSSTSSTAAAPGSSSSSSSTNAAGSSTSFSSTPLSTVVQTTVITENGQTSTALLTSQIAASGTTGAGGSSASGSSSGGGSDSHTGAIVGGVVGGVAFIALLALLAWYLLRRRSKSEFDGNFDPDHVAKNDSSPIQRLGRGGDADLLAAARGVDEPEVTPYTYGMQQQQPGGASFLGPAGAAGLGAGAGYAAGGGRDQKGAGPLANTSYYDPNAPAMPSGPSEAGSGSGSGHGLSDPRTSMSSSGVPYGASPYGPTGGPGAGAGYGMGMGLAPGMYQPTPAAGTPSVPTSHSTYSTYSGAQSKEREAFAARYAQQVGQGQNTLYGGAGASGSAPLTLRDAAPEDEAQSVVVHQDGGRVREEDSEPMNEIPPTYDSIRADEEHH